MTEFKYGEKLGIAFRGEDALKWLYNFGMSKTYCKFAISVKLFIDIFTTDKQIRMDKLS